MVRKWDGVELMNERTQNILGLIAVVSMFIFIGLAVCANIQDELTGSNYAYWFNVVGFCLVPIATIFCYVSYKHITKINDVK